MSLAAAAAMRYLADCMREEADELPAGMAKATMFAMAKAHDKAADRIEERARLANGPVKVPDEFEKNQAGTRR